MGAPLEMKVKGGRSLTVAALMGLQPDRSDFPESHS